jgi:hypothetical protein
MPKNPAMPHMNYIFLTLVRNCPPSADSKNRRA